MGGRRRRRRMEGGLRRRRRRRREGPRDVWGGWDPVEGELETLTQSGK